MIKYSRWIYNTVFLGKKLPYVGVEYCSYDIETNTIMFKYVSDYT